MPRRFPLPQLAAWLLVLAGFVPGWTLTDLRAQGVYDEDSVKAAFLYHFSTFVVWPDTRQADEEFVIAVLGDDDVAEELEIYLPGHAIQGRPMRARRLEDIEDVTDEDVVFIGAARLRSLSADLAALENRPILVVTDAEGALDQGAIINFRNVDQRIRFEISVPAAEDAGLVLSSRLLAAAMFVDTTSAILEAPVDAVARATDFRAD